MAADKASRERLRHAGDRTDVALVTPDGVFECYVAVVSVRGDACGDIALEDYRLWGISRLRSMTRMW